MKPAATTELRLRTASHAAELLVRLQMHQREWIARLGEHAFDVADAVLSGPSTFTFVIHRHQPIGTT